MAFEGFENPNYTQTPNFFFDEILMQKGVTIAEVKILGFMIRMTYGWHRVGNSLQFTYDEIQSACKLGREAVSNGLKKCLEKGYIQRNDDKGKLRYRLFLKDFSDYPWDFEFNWKKVMKLDEHKENNKQFGNRTEDSSEIEPESVRKSNQSQFGNRTGNNVETHEPVSVETSVKKGLKKDLKKELNKNTYLAKIDEINLPENIKRVLVKSVGRLVSDSINLFDLEVHYRANVDKTVNENEYAYVLKYYLDNAKRKIENISALLDKGITKYIEMQSNNKKPISRTEVLPYWFNESEIEKDNNIKADLEIDERTKAIEEKLKKFRNNK